jgi:DNA-binding MarR family transcriptional regulator
MTPIAAPPAPAELAARLRLVVGRLGRVLRASGSGGLTPTQLSALSSLDTRGPLRIGDLAAIEGVGAPAATRIVAAFADAGLVSRHPDPSDARSVLVSANAAGRRKLAALRAARDAGLAHRIEQLDSAELQILTAALPVLERLLDGAAQGAAGGAAGGAAEGAAAATVTP